MTIDPQYLLYGFLGLLLAIYLAMRAMYQHGFHVGQMTGWKEGAEGKAELVGTSRPWRDVRRESAEGRNTDIDEPSPTGRDL